jgi:hypothetical protein
MTALEMLRSVPLVLSAAVGLVFTNGSFETGKPGSVPPGWTVNNASCVTLPE